MKRANRYMQMLRIFLHRGGYPRAEYLKKKGYFGSQGKHCYLQPWNFGTEPKDIYFGNNVHVASNVTFINHDVSVFMLQYMEPETKFKARTGEIHIGNNVFVGANAIILYGVHIGNNVVIGAGSIVTKDIPDGVVAVGSPCKPIESFDEWQEKMKA
ncbi:MAG: acyltransferase [Catenisphaera adipataccumulans]|jgi:acetyltransferase-like isoleucine patch superfamily enzyme|uniref:acyltransferase n=1 Tax=Catenisphaera adipataccumulans TaxID=700500 RepID=UPI003D91F9D9